MQIANTNVGVLLDAYLDLDSLDGFHKPSHIESPIRAHQASICHRAQSRGTKEGKCAGPFDEVLAR